jgi:hypothetical protein
MIIYLLCITYAIFFGALVAWLNQANGNPANLTLRGRRVVFVVAIIIGFVLAYITFNINVNCDLRQGATTACVISWL